MAATPRARLGFPVLLQGHDCLSGCRLCEVGSQAIGLVVNRSCGESRILQSYKKKQMSSRRQSDVTDASSVLDLGLD